MDGLTVALGGAGATIGLLLCSAFFSSSETAIFSLSPDWIDQQATAGDRRAGVLKELRDDPHRLLVTLLVGNNVVNVAISSIVTVLIASYLPPGPAVAVTTVVTSVLILIFGEIVPKAYGLGNAKRWSLTIAAPVRFVERALSPLITLFDGITRRINLLISADPEIEKPLSEATDRDG
ncbi:CNNM domain-containing protein [Natrialbaceae archaeon GCM10025810]|uniref:CNNM domain-containing protein n=1 Tax=Halovalidus salilacus TaxID=3075124 RepID=UPI00360FECCB